MEIMQREIAPINIPLSTLPWRRGQVLTQEARRVVEEEFALGLSDEEAGGLLARKFGHMDKPADEIRRAVMLQKELEQIAQSMQNDRSQGEFALTLDEAREVQKNLVKRISRFDIVQDYIVGTITAPISWIGTAITAITTTMYGFASSYLGMQDAKVYIPQPQLQAVEAVEMVVRPDVTQLVPPTLGFLGSALGLAAAIGLGRTALHSFRSARVLGTIRSEMKHLVI